MQPIAIVTGAATRIPQSWWRPRSGRWGDACAVQADITAAEVARKFRTVDEALGPLTTLVNNAGIIGPPPEPWLPFPLHERSRDEAWSIRNP